jgi:hypothetical protein
MASENARPYAPLEHLPLLILEEICEYLSHMGTGRHNLFVFSQVSKACCDVAKRERFKQILLDAEGDQQMHLALARWRGILSVDNRAKLVRRIKVIGGLMTNVADPAFGGQLQSYAAHYRKTELERQDSEVGDDNLDEDDAFFKPGAFAMHIGLESYFTKENRASANILWRPFADFLSTLPGLKDLIWSSTDQVPYCILDTLHVKLPRTRLRVHTFSLHSLCKMPYRHADIDSDEYALASSPNLFSVCAMVSTLDTNQKRSYTEDALQHMIAGTAPNLRHISLSHTCSPIALDWVLCRQRKSSI